MTDTAGTTIAVCPAAELPPGEMRLVEHDGRQDRRLQLRGHALRDRGSLLPRRRAARRGRVRPGGLHRRVPPPRLPLRPDHRQAEDAPRFRPGANVPDSRRGRHHHPGGLTRHGNARGSRREKRARRHQRRLQGEVRLPRFRVRLRLQGAEGALARDRRIDLRLQGRAAVDARLPAQGAGALLLAPDPEMGRQPRPDRLRRHPLLRPRLGEEQPRLERGPGGHQKHLRPARHPRGGAQIPLRRRRPVRVRGRLPPGQREARGPGRDLHRHGHGAARARGPGARALGDDHPRPTTTNWRR